MGKTELLGLTKDMRGRREERVHSMLWLTSPPVWMEWRWSITSTPQFLRDSGADWFNKTEHRTE